MRDTAIQILADLDGAPPSGFLVEEALRSETQQTNLWRDLKKTMKELDPRRYTNRVLREWLKIAR